VFNQLLASEETVSKDMTYELSFCELLDKKKKTVSMSKTQLMKDKIFYS
jgi:hypothetical protein